MRSVGMNSTSAFLLRVRMELSASTASTRTNVSAWLDGRAKTAVRYGPRLLVTRLTHARHTQHMRTTNARLHKTT